MPNIGQYDNSATLESTETGISSVLTGAARTGSFYDQAGQALSDTGRRVGSALGAVGTVALQYVDQKDRSDISMAATNKLAKLDQDWNLMANGHGKPGDPDYVAPADPRDPSIAGKFMEQATTSLDDLRGIAIGENGQRYADSKIDQIREHLQQKVTADMSIRAGTAATLNDTQTTNQLSNYVSLNPDFHAVDFALQQHKDAAAGLLDNPNLSVAQRGALEQHFQASQTGIIRAAAFAAISKANDPEAVAAEFSKRYPTYIRGDEVNQLAKAAEVVQKSNLVDQERAARMQEKKAQAASDQREVELLTKLHSDDPTEAGSVTAKQVVTDPTLTLEAKERFVGIINREMKPEAAAKVSSATTADLIGRLRLPIGDPNRMDDLTPAYDALSAGKLNKADFKFVQEEYSNLRTPEGEALGKRQAEFIDSVKPLIDKSNPLMGKVDPSGHQQVYSFTLDLQRKVAEYRKAGKDPRDLMDPSKPDYMGSPAALAPYQKPLQQSVRDVANSVRRGGANVEPPAPAVAPPTKVKTPADAQKLSPGTRYETPDGKVYVR